MDLPLMITNRDRAHKAMQDILLEGLKEIDRICRKHGINYSLGGGTCLGQVRHGGFIPWDDDIDIDMTAENYDRFMQIAPSEIDTSRFCLYSRDTDPNFYRSFARLGVLDTSLSQIVWLKADREYCIFIDILRCNYLPDNKHKRQRLINRLFLLRCVQHYKEFQAFANHLDPRRKLLVQFLSSVIPVKHLQKCEDRLANSVKGKTDWMIDNSIIHGAYGGYPSNGVDEYTDVEFEGITVMNKKDPHKFLVSLYGENYMEWLPPSKRISHHTWTKFDIGHFADAYDLDDSYKDFMTVRYSEDKLRQMKKVTDFMFDEVAKVCMKYDIKYTIARLDETDVNRDNVDIDNLWIRPGIVMMLRDEYERFAEVAEAEFGNRLSYQCRKNDPNYYYDYARLHLNYTKIRDRRLRYAAEKGMNSGFFIKIIPLDNYIKDAGTKNNVKKLRFWRRCMYVKWRTTDSQFFMKTPFKDKVKLILLCGYSLEDMCDKIDHYAQIYNGKECAQCFDSSRQLDGLIFNRKDVLEKHEILIERSALSADTIDDVLTSVDKRYGPCYLTYYDEPDRQLSILRYDENTGHLLSNEELFKSANGGN